ncbi:hypothetical protein THOB06_10516 [Vibrio rotiferianus]|nr:hypothetical protein THOG10_10513 [Vibrio rotiferianus]CAH1558406.1 hypothetical protein THOB06_10516 [Vibrio rotiferianus]
MVVSHRDIADRTRHIFGDLELATDALKLRHSSKAFILIPETSLYHLTNLLIMEKVVAKRLIKLRAQTQHWTSEHYAALAKAIAELPYPLMTKQHEAVITSVASSLSCITGGAATGKTVVLRTVLPLMQSSEQ